MFFYRVTAQKYDYIKIYFSLKCPTLERSLDVFLRFERLFYARKMIVSLYTTFLQGYSKNVNTLQFGVLKCSISEQNSDVFLKLE